MNLLEITKNDSLRLQVKKKMNLQCNWGWVLATSIHYSIEKYFS